MIRSALVVFTLLGFASGTAVDTANPAINQIVRDALKDYSENHESTYMKLTALLEGEQDHGVYRVRLLAEPTVCSISQKKDTSEVQKCKIDRKQDTLLCSGTITPEKHVQDLSCAEQVFV
uniref:Cystatin domain-containing protein n=1 Tax=Trichuris muris TaxID=70415 RepID=A0A5S6QG41_TRIMR